MVPEILELLISKGVGASRPHPHPPWSVVNEYILWRLWGIPPGDASLVSLDTSYHNDNEQQYTMYMV